VTRAGGSFRGRHNTCDVEARCMRCIALRRWALSLIGPLHFGSGNGDGHDGCCGHASRCLSRSGQQGLQTGRLQVLLGLLCWYPGIAPLYGSQAPVLVAALHRRTEKSANDTAKVSQALSQRDATLQNAYSGGSHENVLSICRGAVSSGQCLFTHLSRGHLSVSQEAHLRAGSHSRRKGRLETPEMAPPLVRSAGIRLQALVRSAKIRFPPLVRSAGIRLLSPLSLPALEIAPHASVGRTVAISRVPGKVPAPAILSFAGLGPTNGHRSKMSALPPEADIFRGGLDVR